MQLAGKVSLVTGAGSGIGRAIAERLAREGAAVVVNDVDEPGGAETVRAIEAAGGCAAFVRADVSVEDDSRAMIEFARTTFGDLDVLVNNAGVYIHAPWFPDAAPESWTRILDVYLHGTMLAIHFGVRAMRSGKGGVIVNIASMAGLGTGPAEAAEYAAAKAAIVRLTAALRTLHESAGVRVNCICPGWVDTPMSRRTVSEMTPQEQQALPPVMLRPEEIADAVLRFVREDEHAGRVMVCPEGAAPYLIPVTGPG